MNHNNPQTVVDWIFARGSMRASCRVDRQRHCDDRPFAVRLVVNTRDPRSPVEVFPRLVDAFGRHAALVADLRAAGWQQVGHTEARSGTTC